MTGQLSRCREVSAAGGGSAAAEGGKQRQLWLFPRSRDAKDGYTRLHFRCLVARISCSMKLMRRS